MIARKKNCNSITRSFRSEPNHLIYFILIYNLIYLYAIAIEFGKSFFTFSYRTSNH